MFVSQKMIALCNDLLFYVGDWAGIGVRLGLGSDLIGLGWIGDWEIGGD